METNKDLEMALLTNGMLWKQWTKMGLGEKAMFAIDFEFETGSRKLAEKLQMILEHQGMEVDVDMDLDDLKASVISVTASTTERVWTAEDFQEMTTLMFNTGLTCDCVYLGCGAMMPDNIKNQ